MAFSYIQGDLTEGASTVQLLGCANGSLVVAWLKSENNAVVTSVSNTGGETVNLLTNNSHSNNDLDGMFVWFVSTSAGDKVLTPSFSTSATFTRFRIAEFGTTGTPTVAAEDASAEGTGDCLSGLITISGSDLLVLGANGEYTGVDPTSPLINGAAATFVTDGSTPGSYSRMWYKILTSGFTNGAAGATSPSLEWICSVVAFTTAAAASSLPPRRADFTHMLVR